MFFESAEILVEFGCFREGMQCILNSFEMENYKMLQEN